MSRRVYYPGVWDLLHVGHIAALELAATHGDYLLVSVPDDEVVEQDKGEKPIIKHYDRAKMLLSLKIVTTAVIRHELSFLRDLEAFRPDVIAIGEHWGKEERHRELEDWAMRHGAVLVRIPYFKFESTTKIKQRVQDRLCHNFNSDDYAAFCDGCDEYQRKVFGKCRTDILLASLETEKAARDKVIADLTIGHRAPPDTREVPIAQPPINPAELLSHEISKSEIREHIFPPEDNDNFGFNQTVDPE